MTMHPDELNKCPDFAEKVSVAAVNQGIKSGHARLGPSNHRWPHCPGSVREEAKYPDIPGEAAIDGTGSHLLLEMCLENNVPAAQYDQQIIGANHPDHPGGWLVGTERIKRVQMALDYITRRVKELREEYPHSTVTVESETISDPGELFQRDDWWGTCDITIICRHQHTGELYFVEVCDYKDGRGFVSAKDNTQLLSYMIGKLRPFITKPPKGCRMSIVQPKTNPAVRYQCSTVPEDNLTVEGVLKKAVDLNRAAMATDDPDAPLVAGKHCQWCKANPKRGGHCTASVNESIDVVTTMSNTEMVKVGEMPAFEYISKAVADPKSLTSDQLSELMSAKEALMAAFDKCEAEIVERIEQGQHVNGYAMEPGRSVRKWNESEEEIVKKLKSRKLKLEDIYPKKLVSPAQVLKSEKLTDSQKKRIESELVSVVAGKLTLKKVKHSVAQSSTDDLQSAQQMFADVPAPAETVADSNDEISFF